MLIEKLYISGADARGGGVHLARAPPPLKSEKYDFLA